MTNNRIAEQHHATFEGIRQQDGADNEYWSARKLAKVLEYSEYRHFQPVIERAREACQGSGYAVSDHFEDVLEMVAHSSDSERWIDDPMLARYDCHLIAQNRENIIFFSRFSRLC